MVKFYSAVLFVLSAFDLAAQKQTAISSIQKRSRINHPVGAVFRQAASGCDTVNYPVPDPWTIAYYVAGTNGNDGFVTGNNVYNDQEKAAYFDASSSANTFLTKVWIGFAVANSSGANLSKIISIRIYDGTFGEPGATLGTATKSLSELHSDQGSNAYTEVVFPGAVSLPLSKKFFVSVDVSSLTWNQTDGFDSLAVYSNTANQSTAGSNGFGWEKNNGTWATIGQGWGVNLALIIHPFLSTNPTCSLNSAPYVTVSGKVYLQGPYNPGSGTMNNALNTSGLLQTNAGSQPYNISGFGYSGTESVATGFFAGHPDIVDWVLIELHDASVPATVVATRAAFVKQDGSLIEIDGLSNYVTFPGIPTGNYCVALRHRNHLGVMTANALLLSNTAPAVIDFTSPATVTYGTNAQRSASGITMMWAGDINGDKKISYNGGGNDKNAILAKVGLTTPNNILNVYDRADVNLDGTVRYNGAANDKNVLLIAIGLLTPNNIITEQIPK